MHNNSPKIRSWSSKRIDSKGLRLADVALFSFVVLATTIGRTFTAINAGKEDAQLFAFMGQWLAEGGNLYIDMWDNKPPGIFLINELTFLLFPHNFISIATVEFVFILCSLCIFWRILKNCEISKSARYLGISLYAVTVNLASFNEGGNLTEIYAQLPILLSALFLFHGHSEKTKGRMEFIAGIFGALAFFVKPPAFTVILTASAFLSLSIAFEYQRRLISTKKLAAMLSGVALVFLSFSLWYLKNGAFREFVEATLIHNMHYGKTSVNGFIASIYKFLTGIQPALPIVGLSAAGLILFFSNFQAKFKIKKGTQPALENRGNYFLIFTAAWLTLDLLALFSAGRWYGHYFLLIMPSLCLLASFSYNSILNEVRGMQIGQGLPLALHLTILSLPLSHLALDALKLNRIITSPETSSELSPVIGYLTKNRVNGDTLFTSSYIPNLNYETGMKSPVKFLSLHYLADSYWAANRYGDELFHQLSLAPPTYVVVESSNSSRLESDKIRLNFDNFLKNQYSLQTNIRSKSRAFAIYRHAMRR